MVPVKNGGVFFVVFLAVKREKDAFPS